MNMHSSKGAGLYYILLYFKQGTRLLWRNRFWSVITLTVMTLLLFVVYVMLSMSAHTTTAAKRVDDRLTITAIIAQNANFVSVKPTGELANRVRSLNDVKSVRIISEAESRSVFLKNIGNLRQPPDVKVFFEALEISVTDTKKIDQVKTSVAAIPGIQSASYLGELVKKLTAVSSYLQRIALYGAILLSLVAILVVMAVVRTSVHAEKKSVETMSNVGGSHWSVSAPLLVHLGIVTTIAAVLACIGGYAIDPQIGSGFGESVRNLPDWLRTGRSYGLFTLLPILWAASAAAVSVIVIMGTRRYMRSTVGA